MICPCLASKTCDYKTTALQPVGLFRLCKTVNALVKLEMEREVGKCQGL